MKTIFPFILAFAFLIPDCAHAQINVTKNGTTGEVTQNFTIATGKGITLNGTISGPGSITSNVTGNVTSLTGNFTTLTTSSLQVSGNGTVLSLLAEGTTTLSAGLGTVTVSGTLPTSRVFLSRWKLNTSAAISGVQTVITTTNSFTINATSTANATVSDNSTFFYRVTN